MSDYELAHGEAVVEAPLGTEGSTPEEAGTGDANELILHPRDADVLCGRGGAALRHPGNQTYRRLVNLNKGLYITCLKTEKLKISRSIVAAIREQKGRFLEKSADQNSWYDIGDKKAVEKTSQALREGQPKLRQKIIEMGVAVNPNESEPLGDGSEHDIIVGLNTFDPQYGTIGQQNLSMLQQQQMLHQGYDPQRNILPQQNNDMGQQLMQQQLQPLAMSSSSINNSQDLHAELLRRLSLHDLQQNMSTSSGFQQQQQQSMTSIQNNVPQQPTPSEQQLLNHQQQLLYSQQQNRSQTPQRLQIPNSRASLARELGISESQLSIMSDLSAYGGGSMSGFGSMRNGSSQINASGHSNLGNTSSLTDVQALMNIDSSFRNLLMGLPSINTVGRDQSLLESTMSSITSNSNAPIYVNNNLTQQQYQQQHFYQPQQQNLNSHAAMSQKSPGVPMNRQPMQQQPSVTSSTTGMGSASGSQGDGTLTNNHFDRRRIFAKMKYTRPPSVQSVSGGGVMGASQNNIPSSEQDNGADQQQQHQQTSGLTSQTMHTTSTTDDMTNFHLVDNTGMESTMSFFSTVSDTPLQTASNVAANTAVAGTVGRLPNNITTGDVDNSAVYNHDCTQKQQYNNNTSNNPTMNPPPNFTSYDTGFSKVVVETARVIDHSSGGGRYNGSTFNDAMSIESRQSLLSGLSRISDTSYDNSIFSDLSKKIGNVSTRSMAMSEMSALEIQELNEDDDHDDLGEGHVDDDSAPGDIDNYGGETTTNV